MTSLHSSVNLPEGRRVCLNPVPPPRSTKTSSWESGWQKRASFIHGVMKR